MPNNKAKLIIGFLLITAICGLMVMACKKSEPENDLQIYIDQLKQKASKPTKSTLSNITVLNPFAYRADSLRAPFGEKQSVKNNTLTSKEIESNPLLAYSLSVLRFLGTLSEESRTFAFVQAPDGMVYQVKLGGMIGDHHGKIINIQADQMDIMEEVSDDGKSNRQHVVTLRLRE